MPFNQRLIRRSLDIAMRNLHIEIRERTPAKLDLEQELRTLHEVNVRLAFLRAVRLAELDDCEDMLL